MIFDSGVLFGPPRISAYRQNVSSIKNLAMDRPTAVSPIYLIRMSSKIRWADFNVRPYRGNIVHFKGGQIPTKWPSLVSSCAFRTKCTVYTYWLNSSSWFVLSMKERDRSFMLNSYTGNNTKHSGNELSQ